MMTAEQARTLACAGGAQLERALAALASLRDIDHPAKAQRLVVLACAIHAQMLHATAIQLISAKGRRLDRIPLDPGDYASGSYRLAVSLANGFRAIDRKVLGVGFRPQAPAPLYDDAPWILEHVGAYSLDEISLDIEGQIRELKIELKPMSAWSPAEIYYQRLVRSSVDALQRVQWQAQRPAEIWKSPR